MPDSQPGMHKLPWLHDLDSALLTDGFWVLLGYCMLLLSGALFMLFR